MKTTTYQAGKAFIYFLFLSFLTFNSFSQNNKSAREIGQHFEKSLLGWNQPLDNQHIWASSFDVYNLNFAALNSELVGIDIPHRDESASQNKVTMQLPNPNGGFDMYRVMKNSTMHPELEAKYPEIRTYDVICISDRFKKGKIDVTPHGFHAMIFDRVNGTFFIDPVQMGNTHLYMLYKKSDFTTSKTMACTHEEHNHESMLKDFIDQGDDVRLSYASCVLRTYRLAVAATGEYTTFHGGTVALALAAQVTSMNRVNGVFEREIAITMQLIPNNDLIIYTDAATDPYTNGTPGTMIGQNQTNITSVIGSANFDIGHVFGTNSGGLAGLGVVCSNTNKARGVTGSSAPVGDPFDIDYVAHEMGHQFGANHTQNNNCNSVANSRYEPGSASTIMGYAGICAPNVQSNSDDYFHSRSLQEIGTFISGASHTCPQVTNIANQAPSISSTNAGVSLPISTPFALTATATDPNASNSLVYRWEQYNNQASTQPPLATATGGPNFRSFVSSPSPTRYFPNLTALANNGPFTWEVVPSITRTMAFRVTVHDDHTIGGCSDYVSTTVNFDASAGPFVLTYPSANGITWPSGTQQTVTWNVASTDNTAINCQTVKIFLSTNGGTSYPILLADNVPNTGSYEVTTPNLPNTTSRVMVMAANGTFFDISDNNFTISAPDLGFVAQLNTPSVSVCQGMEANLEFSVNAFGNFDGPVTFAALGLPQNTVIEWTNNPVDVPGSTTCVINTNNLMPNVYPIEITVTGSTGTQTIMASLSVTSQIADANFNLVGQQLVANQFSGQHQWFDCSTNPPSIIAGATAPTLPLVEPTGSYALQVTNGGCVARSACVDIDMSGLLANGLLGILLHPNPANDEVQVSWDSAMTLETLKLYDAAGKLILVINQPTTHQVINLSRLSRGMYFLEFTGTQISGVSKIIKN